MQMTRRNFLCSTGIGAVSIGAAGCSSVNWADVQAAWNQFVDNVTALVAAGCNAVQGFIPTVVTIADAVAALYGAGAEQFVAGIGGAINRTASQLCTAITPVQKNPQFQLRLARASETAPIVIGVVRVTPVNGGPPVPVTVHGYSNRAGARRRYGNVYQLYQTHRGAAERAYQNAAPSTRHQLDLFAR